MAFRATVSHLSTNVFGDTYVCLRLVQPFRLFWKCYTFTYSLYTFVLRLSWGSWKCCVWIKRLDTFGATVSWILGHTHKSQNPSGLSSLGCLRGGGFLLIPLSLTSTPCTYHWASSNVCKNITLKDSTDVVFPCARNGRRGLHYGHLVLNRALHYVWLRLRYVSITFESTLQILGKRGPVKYGADP